MDIQVTRGLHISAPEGDAVYAHPVCTGSDTLVEDVRHAAMHVRPDGAKHYYARRLYRRRSEDNGRTWTEEPDLQRLEPGRLESLQRHPLALVAHPQRNVLFNLYFTHEVDLGEDDFARGNRIQRTQRTYYESSADGGKTWTDRRQVVDARPGYDETHWAPGVTFGKQGARAAGQPVFLPDGTLAIGFDIFHPEPPPGFPARTGYYITTRYARARLNEEGNALEWRFGDEITVDFPRSMVGCCEQALAWLGGTRLFNTMRCQGSERHGIPSTRYATVSEDGGLTWSEPTPLVYDDGRTVWTPASVHRFFRSSATGRTYLLANILPEPVYGQTPRYPLCIAEFDTGRLCVLRETVRTIQDLPEDAPKSRRYTNFGMYEDRQTGDLVLTMPEQPGSVDFEAMTRPEDFTSDCIELRIRIEP